MIPKGLWLKNKNEFIIAQSSNFLQGRFMMGIGQWRQKECNKFSDENVRKPLK